MFGVDFSQLHFYLLATFIIPIVIYTLLGAVVMPHWRRFLKGTIPALLVYCSGCFLSYLLADPLLNILRIPGSAYIFASFFVFALVLICSSFRTMRKIKKAQEI
jgi:hypothetical protein